MDDHARVRVEEIGGDAEVSEPSHCFVIENVVSRGGTSTPPHIVTPSDYSVAEGHVLTVAGLADRRATIELFDWLDVVGKAVASDGGTWSVTLDTVEFGEHVYSARAVHETGTHSDRSSPVVVTVVPPDKRASLEASRRRSLRHWSAGRSIVSRIRLLGRSQSRTKGKARSEVDEDGEQVVIPPDMASHPAPMEVGRDDESHLSEHVECEPEIQIRAVNDLELVAPVFDQGKPNIPTRFLRRCRHPFRCGPYWTPEEQAWIEAQTFPPVLVRSYGKVKHLKQDATRLSLLGYDLVYQRWDWSGPGEGRATFRQQHYVSLKPATDVHNARS